MKIRCSIAALLAALALGSCTQPAAAAPREPLPPQVGDLWIANLGLPPADRSNRWADDPAAATAAGRRPLVR